MATPKIPDLQDTVKNILNETTGKVITVYEKNGVRYLDVRGDDYRIYYDTPASNWEVVIENDDQDD